MIRFIRDIALPVVVSGAALLLPIPVLVAATIVLSYPHYFLGYLYRYRSAPQQRPYLAVAPVVIAAFFIFCFSIGVSSVFIFIASSLIFTAHFAFDEFFLHGERIQRGQWLMLSAFLLFYAIPTMGAGFNLGRFGTILPLIPLALMGVRLANAGGRAHATEKYLALVACLLFGISLMGSPLQVLTAVILLHAYNWYDWGARRAAQEPKRAISYWRDVIVLNAIFFLMFMFYAFAKASFLDIFFNPIFYYCWSAGHIALSIRFSGGKDANAAQAV